MFLYQKGKEHSFDILAENHYTGLEGKRKLKNRDTFYAYSLTEKIKNYAVDRGTGSQHFFLDLLEDNFKWLKQIITGTPEILAQAIETFERHIISGRYPQMIQRVDDTDKYTEFGYEIVNTFSYSVFSSKSTKYNAYIFCEALDISVCPYCNRNYALTVVYRGKGMVRPELDHYVPKSKYPYLALSFYNLIPSCHLCNANLKHATHMNFTEYLHPYMTSLHDVLAFSVSFREKTFLNARLVKEHFGIDFFYGKSDTFDIILKARAGIPSNIENIARRNIVLFRIQELYNYHKDMVQEIIQSAIVYNDEYINTLMTTFKDDLFHSREDVLRMITRQYVNLDTMPKRPFSKFSRDINEEFGIKF